MHFTDAKGILSSTNGMNLCRGCSHGCIYCDARSKCYQFTHEFEDIEVKQNAPQLLEQALRSKRKKRYQRKYGLAYEVTSDNHKELMNNLRRRCNKSKIICDVEKCFAYLREFPEKYEQMSLFY